MKQTNISVGLDIGTTKIVALVGKKNEFNKVEILGMGKSKSLGVHRGVVNNITQTIQSIQQAVEDAIINSKQEINDVVYRLRLCRRPLFRMSYDLLIDVDCFSIGFVALNQLSIDLHRFSKICVDY